VLSGLVGRRILVTCPRTQPDELEAALASLGARPISFPTIDIRPVQDLAPLDRAIDALDRYAWIAFTSANSVATFFYRLARRAGAIPPGVRIAAVGPGTARALTAFGARVDFVPSEFLGERLGQELADVDGRRVLFPRAAGAREAAL
jgi:uroporphyrinogen-III synthase